MEIELLFEFIGCIINLRLLEMIGRDLKADRSVFGTDAARYRNCRHARQVRRDRQDVILVHPELVVDLFADVISRTRRRRSDDQVVIFKDPLHVRFDDRTELLGTDVILIIVSCAEDESAEQYTALHFFAETFSAGLLVKLLKRFCTFSSVAETDAVETRKV